MHKSSASFLGCLRLPRISKLLRNFMPLGCAALLFGCQSAGPYGHARHYAPQGVEAELAPGARDYDPVLAARRPDEFRRHLTSIFGIVRRRAIGPGGSALLTLSVRRLEPLNLCENARDESTCRVTVTVTEFGTVQAQVVVLPSDDLGEDALGAGSLVRVLGTLADAPTANDGSPLFIAKAYRHYPRGTFVTSASAEVMRQ
jgi:hypothetical protein